jgi:hypothetical protein
MEAATLRPGNSRTTVVFVGLLSLLVGILALCVNRGHNGDVYLQLATGRFISQHGFVWTDPFATIAQGQHWANQQWLSELFFYNLSRSVGMTGLTLVYAFVLGLALFFVLWYCRDKEVVVLLGGAAFFFAALLSIPHPRAAGFSLLAFSILVVLLLRAMREGETPKWLLIAVPALFLVWANVHGGLVAGLFLIGLVAVGLLINRRPVALVAVAGVLAFAATFATPLGADLWSYITSFRNPALSLGTKEWGPGYETVNVMVYVAAAAAFSGWLWTRRSPGSSLTPLLVPAGFLVATVFSTRNMVFIAPALFFQIAYTRVRTGPMPLRPALAVGAAAAGAAVVWLTVLGPAPTAPYLKDSPADFAVHHPPKQGRIASIGGVSSYMIWRAPHTRVMIDGWLEHFSPAVLRATYGTVRARPGKAPDTARWDIGGVITRDPRAAQALKAQGFVVRRVTPQGVYLVRTLPR